MVHVFNAGKMYVKIGHGGYFEEMLSSLDEVRRWYTEPADLEVVQKLKTLFHSIVKGKKSHPSYT